MSIKLPVTRGDCLDGPRPCPHTTCRYHLQEAPRRGRGRRLTDLPAGGETCALDLADRGGMTLEEVSEVLGVVRERVRQIEDQALDKLYVHGGLSEFKHHTPTCDLLATPNEAIGDGLGCGDGCEPLSMAGVSFGAEGDDESWCDRVWRAYVRASS